MFDDVTLKNALPDYMDGLRKETETGLLREYLDKYIVPAERGPFLPNFFCEPKGPDATVRVAQVQAMHDGALGARGMYAARIAAGEDALDSKAVTFSATLTVGDLELFAHFVTQPNGEGTHLHYHMCELGSYSLKHSAAGFREAVTAYRNLNELALRERTDIASAAARRIALGPLPEIKIVPATSRLASVQAANALIAAPQNIEAEGSEGAAAKKPRRSARTTK